MIYVLFLIVHLHKSCACSLLPLKKYLASKSPTIAFCSRHVLCGCYHNIEVRFNFPGSLYFFTGNFITVIVFWIHRCKLKRTSFLLINLAVADLLAGVTQAAMAAQPVPQTISADISACFQAAFWLHLYFSSFSSPSSTPSNNHQCLHLHYHNRVVDCNNLGYILSVSCVRHLRIQILHGSLLLCYFVWFGYHLLVLRGNPSKT